MSEILPSTIFQMPKFTSLHRFLSCFTSGILIGLQLPSLALHLSPIKSESEVIAQNNLNHPNFLVMGGGSSPCNNEIALEKNILYFQRVLQHFGYNPEDAGIFFANGNNGQTTVRYLDEQKLEQYKVPTIPSLDGSATRRNFQSWLEQSQNTNKSIFFYLTGHGGYNEKDPHNNSFDLWHRQRLTVKELATMLDRLPPQTSFVAMMAQCYSGSFANLIYQGGDPKNPIALQTRCGFFATIKELPSVGCTPEVNEADYRDYSSSFFAGLSGISRTGEKVTSADYNQDGKVSYAEAHAFAKIDDKTIDRPISTSEVWLRSKASEADIDVIFTLPFNQLLGMATPERRYVVNSLIKILNLDPGKSFGNNRINLSQDGEIKQLQQTYLIRLSMELIYIGMEQKIRNSQNRENIAILDRLINCEGGYWDRNHK
ncbi:MAG TPA: Caspase domain-containing protein [Cyanobacteria bacterium UBA11149]|nr:Caspase domain-containing protein [Cyanobacteria bacterium UBA11367]HBE56388.1 Caspase domain-containing protein [Cyanobacteria bacterium UBA11366]HBK63164.1 Caspase domain-containing protein [Cyanobacteria bacterium UBA11166]HBR76359.1 Caspase domain-containing protein [Cyanobacteria bacterium UBA11159]HBS71555.1 Caspase domain-containing protein [Cyanobacteria bacterium UBA11153]HBW88824.1 Caspase domain-containing protein [Cyanobacteria bacterium UBA11149]HCA94173.1 Caspase domain-conta